MGRLYMAFGIVGVLLLSIVGGLFAGNAGLSSVACLFGWTPAMVFLGWTMARANVQVVVGSLPNKPTPPRPTQSLVKRESVVKE